MGKDREHETARPIGIGHQDFAYFIANHIFYVDKTKFIKEWWEYHDAVTLITRPRRFGKTLNMSMVEYFLSASYAQEGWLFDGLSIWKEEKYRRLQGTYPVISLSFASVKEASFYDAKEKICYLIEKVYNRCRFLTEGELLNKKEFRFFQKVSSDMEMYVATSSLGTLSEFLYRYYGKRVVILLDEYDTPMQEAYLHGYWEELAAFIRNLFNDAFKSNQYLERAILTGITRVGKESIFSDLNNLEVVTTTSEKYADAFGFTKQEVEAALAEYGLSDKKEEVAKWYNGFLFGRQDGIYNPWSVIHFLDKRECAAYWSNTSSNSLVEKLIREGSREVKIAMEDLLQGKVFYTQLEEQIVFKQLDHRTSAVWSLLLATGYLKVHSLEADGKRGRATYGLVLTNQEVRHLFEEMVEDWFMDFTPAYNEFIRALLNDDRKAMNRYLNEVALATFSSFDSGNKPSEKSEPERFYHGFILGLVVDLAGRYMITSNRESGYGRYDVMMQPLAKRDPAVIMEFKVYDPDSEKTLEDTVKAALKQIQEKKYASVLEKQGVAPERIRQYGFAFKGKRVLIG